MDMEQVSPTCRAFASPLQACVKDLRMFVSALGELQGQLGSLEPRPRVAAPPCSELMQRVVAAAPSPRLDEYLAGRGPVQPAPQRTLAEEIDDNLCLLQLLAQEVQELLQQMQAAFGKARDASADGAAAVEPSLLMAAVLDGLEQHMEMLVRVADAAALDTPPDELASYATLLGLEPFLQQSLLDECLSWAPAQATARPAGRQHTPASQAG